MLHLPLRTVGFILDKFEKNLESYAVETYRIDDFEKVLVIEDSLVLYVGKILSNSPVCLNADKMYAWTAGTPYMDMPVANGEYYELYIEEVTYNSLGFKYNHSRFLRDMEVVTGIQYLSLDISYTKFKGYTRIYWCPERETLVEQIGNLLPDLRLRERYEAWEGLHYYFVVMMFVNSEGVPKFSVAYTTQKPYSYINGLIGRWLKDYSMIGSADGRSERGFRDAVFSHKGERFKQRFEQHFCYTFVEKNFREKDDVWQYADTILERACKDEFKDLEWSTYLRSVNKWTTEEMVYNYAKKLFKEHVVIYQHRPFFLKTDAGGQMSYDIYISGLKVAIEYQGKQHFEPVEFFGGEEGFQKTVARDKLKKEASERNGVKLIYINHWEVITLELIRERVRAALNQ